MFNVHCRILLQPVMAKCELVHICRAAEAGCRCTSGENHAQIPLNMRIKIRMTRWHGICLYR